MPQLRSIALYQFKNYASRSFEFNRRIVAICGDNGLGKTNLLDAIHYLCFTRSYFSRLDGNNVQQGRQGFRIEGEFVTGPGIEKAVCIFRENGKKEFSVNGQLYEKLSLHIGRYPCVVIAPDDAVLVTGGSEERRGFMDALLAQLDAEYLQQLITYARLVQQRNSLLRSFAERNARDYSLLDVLDEQLIKPGELIFRRRKEFFAGFLPRVAREYNAIANKKEELHLEYQSQLQHGSFSELLKASRQKDCMACRSTCGVHRDELDIRMGEHHFKNIASQGQRKSLLFALKLAEMDVLTKEKGFAPLLLLDDVFEKLDESRIGNLLQRVCVDNDGQVFITDTNRARLAEHLDNISAQYQLIEL